MSFPPPLWFLIVLSAVAGLLAGVAVLLLMRDNGQPQSWKLTAAIVIAVVATQQLAPSTWKWLITPVAVRLDDGRTGFGRWDVDRQGNGLTEVTVDDVTCTHSYNGRDPARYVQSGFSCNGRYMGVSRVIRDGVRGWLTQGDGVFRLRDPDGHMAYGWYVFGPAARLATLTGGRFGLPDGVPDKAAFDAMDVRGRAVQAGG